VVATAFSFVVDKIENFMAIRAEAVMGRIESSVSSRLSNLNVEGFLKIKAEDLYNKINSMSQDKLEEKRLKLKTVMQKIKPLLDEIKSVRVERGGNKDESSPGNAY
jgi:hypothetical protein